MLAGWLQSQPAAVAARGELDDIEELGAKSGRPRPGPDALSRRFS